MKPTKKLIGAAPVIGTLLGGPLGGPLGGVIGGAASSAMGGSRGGGGVLARMLASAQEGTMPTANDAAAQAARRRRMLMNQARSGRQSTLLSTANTLG